MQENVCMENINEKKGRKWGEKRRVFEKIGVWIWGRDLSDVESVKNRSTLSIWKRATLPPHCILFAVTFAKKADDRTREEKHDCLIHLLYFINVLTAIAIHFKDFFSSWSNQFWTANCREKHLNLLLFYICFFIIDWYLKRCSCTAVKASCCNRVSFSWRFRIAYFVCKRRMYCFECEITWGFFEKSPWAAKLLTMIVLLFGVWFVTYILGAPRVFPRHLLVQCIVMNTVLQSSLHWEWTTKKTRKIEKLYTCARVTDRIPIAAKKPISLQSKL